MPEKHLCCCIPNQEKPNERCQNPAEYQIWSGWEPRGEQYTESCADHLESMLDDSVRFEILRIT